MSERSAILADGLQRAIDDVDNFIDEVSDEGWHAQCPDEQCTVAALVCHIGSSNAGMLNGLIKPIAEGTPRLEFTIDDLHRWNAEAAQQNAAASKSEARDMLRSQSAQAIAYVRGLSDEQLARTFEIAMRAEPVTLDAMIAGGMTGHPREHLASAKAAAGMTD